MSTDTNVGGRAFLWIIVLISSIITLVVVHNRNQEPETTQKQQCRPGLDSVCLADGSKLRIGDSMNPTRFNCSGNFCGYPAKSSIPSIDMRGKRSIETMVVTGDSGIKLYRVSLGMTFKQAQRALPEAKRHDFRAAPGLLLEADGVEMQLLFQYCQGTERGDVVLVGKLPERKLEAVVLAKPGRLSSIEPTLAAPCRSY